MEHVIFEITDSRFLNSGDKILKELTEERFETLDAARERVSELKRNDDALYTGSTVTKKPKYTILTIY